MEDPHCPRRVVDISLCNINEGKGNWLCEHRQVCMETEGRLDLNELVLEDRAAVLRGGCASTADEKWKEEYPLLSTSSI